MMGERQFIIIGQEYVGYTNAYIISNGLCKLSVWESEDDAQKVCDYLNKQQDYFRKSDKECHERVMNYQEEIKELEETNKAMFNRLKEQSEIIYQLRQKLKGYVTKKELREMMEDCGLL